MKDVEIGYVTKEEQQDFIGSLFSGNLQKVPLDSIVIDSSMVPGDFNLVTREEVDSFVKELFKGKKVL